MKKHLILSAIVLSLALVSCSKKVAAVTEKKTSAPIAQKEEPILNSVWKVQQIQQQRVKASNFGQELPYVDLHTDVAAFTGFAGCNRMKGTLVRDKTNGIKFTDVITTKMMCETGNMESQFLSALQKSSKYEIKDGLLYMADDLGKLQLIFVQK